MKNKTKIYRKEDLALVYSREELVLPFDDDNFKFIDKADFNANEYVKVQGPLYSNYDINDVYLSKELFEKNINSFININGLYVPVNIVCLDVLQDDLCCFKYMEDYFEPGSYIDLFESDYHPVIDFDDQHVGFTCKQSSQLIDAITGHIFKLKPNGEYLACSVA